MAQDKATVTVEQAYDGAPIAEVPFDQWAKADTFLTRATALHADRKQWLPAHERIAILKRLARLVENESEAFSLLIAREGGKPLADARVEVDRAVNGLDLAAEEIGGLGGQEIPMDLSAGGAGRIAFTQRSPIGPVVAISAFNHPLNLIVHQVAPAIATGCPVMVKPAMTTPLSCLRFVELAHEAGLPPEWCQAIICDDATAQRLVTDPRVAFFSFIGSARIGWMLQSKLSPGTRCALEHGGVAPAIVAADADLEAVVPSIVKGGFYHSGQVCVSIQRIFVERSKVDDFNAALVSAVKKLNVGDPTDAATEAGPLILPREVDRVEAWVEEAVAGGAKVLTGGKRVSAHVYEPTVLLEPAPDAKVSTLEVFGPVVCIYAYDDIDEAVTRANALSVAFQSTIYTKDIDRALNAAQNLAGGAVMINDHSAFRVDWMPFAGKRSSGLGVGGIRYTMHDMTDEKMIVIKLAV